MRGRHAARSNAATSDRLSVRFATLEPQESRRRMSTGETGREGVSEDGERRNYCQGKENSGASNNRFHFQASTRATEDCSDGASRFMKNGWNHSCTGRLA